MLMLSGIQHFRFCPRQWALIHIEQQWEDNRLTIEGHILHKHVDDPFYRQKCGELITLRSVDIASRELGLYGISDAIELHPSSSEENTIRHPKYPGLWKPVIVEISDRLRDIVRQCASDMHELFRTSILKVSSLSDIWEQVLE